MRCKSMAKCHPDKIMASRGLCWSCYNKLRKTDEFIPRKKEMAKCHPDRKNAGNGLCSKCYIKQYRNSHREKWTEYEERLKNDPVRFERIKRNREKYVTDNEQHGYS